METAMPNMDISNATNATSNGYSVPSMVGLVLPGIVMISIIVGAIIGNLLVIISVIKYEKLRIITNYVIVSLACADLVVAVLAMPFNFSIYIMSGKWLFGRFFCDMYFSNDVLFSTASIIHICLISTDRYIAIIHPLRYESKMSKRRVAIMLGVTWTASALVSYIPVNTQIYTTKENLAVLDNNPEICEFVVNKTYAFISSSVSFWIPSFVMICLYARIYREARKQEKQMQTLLMNKHLCASPKLTNGSGRNDVPSRTETRRMKREHKAAKTLGIIMGAFILCWLPFFLWYLTWTICGEVNCPVSGAVITVLFWIGYSNSLLNPVIYAYFNRDFRHAFKKILHLEVCCKPDPTQSPYANYTSEHRDSTTLPLNEMNSSNRSPCRYAR